MYICTASLIVRRTGEVLERTRLYGQAGRETTTRFGIFGSSIHLSLDSNLIVICDDYVDDDGLSTVVVCVCVMCFDK
jgi:hypothetical protein